MKERSHEVSQDLGDLEVRELQSRRESTHVHMRGKENVLGEVGIIFTAYNLRRCVSILGFEGLLKRLRTLFHVFWGKLLLSYCMEDYMFKFNLVNKLLYDEYERQLEKINLI